jgi:uncharacterized protein
MEIPYQKIPHEILINMIREFIMREGTDYTHRDISIEEKIEQVLKQIKDGRVVITFDTETESFTIIPKNQT